MNECTNNSETSINIINTSRIPIPVATEIVLMAGFLVLTLAALLLCGAQALHPSVVELTPSNFKSKVLESDKLWIVEFFGLYHI